MYNTKSSVPKQNIVEPSIDNHKNDKTYFKKCVTVLEVDLININVSDKRNDQTDWSNLSYRNLIYLVLESKKL